MNADCHQCRSCLTQDGELKSIFKEGKILNEIITLATLLNELLNTTVTKEDGLPWYLCNSCILKLIKATSFKRNCLKAYDSFASVVKSKASEEWATEWTLDDIDEDAENIQIIEIDEKQRVLLEEIDCVDIESETDANNDETGGGESELVFRKYKQRSDSKDSKNITYECGICGKHLSKLSSYRYHMDLHSDVEKYECSECKAKFKTKNAYKGHMNTHTNIYTCDICQKSYRQSASLKNHMLSHDPSKAKPFFCAICDKDFTQKSGLKKHLLTHSDTKLFKCTEVNCLKEFRYSSNYYVHLKSHRGEKNFQCEVCSKKFSSKEQVKRHNLLHTGEKPFSCEICKRAFNRKSALTVHMGIHEKIKRYQCEKCNKGFNQPQGLKAHKCY